MKRKFGKKTDVIHGRNMHGQAGRQGRSTFYYYYGGLWLPNPLKIHSSPAIQSIQSTHTHTIQSTHSPKTTPPEEREAQNMGKTNGEKVESGGESM